MKSTILSLLIVFFAGCSKDTIKRDPTFQLPPETQIGANTFGVTINGKVYIPRDPTGLNVGAPAKGMLFWKSPFDENTYDELEVKDGASSIGFKIILHVQNIDRKTVLSIDCGNGNIFTVQASEQNWRLSRN